MGSDIAQSRIRPTWLPLTLAWTLTLRPEADPRAMSQPTVGRTDGARMKSDEVASGPGLEWKAERNHSVRRRGSWQRSMRFASQIRGRLGGGHWAALI